jgi:hypothetical protein
MHVRFLGDSFDIVKQSLLRWLAQCGPWSAHPMFTEEVTVDQADAFSHLLGVPLISREVLSRESDRAAYFAAARTCSTHLFLDPDTGLFLGRAGRRRKPRYLYADEIAAIAARPGALTLVFDQSFPHGGERACLEKKLSILAAEGLSGVAYVSHACFILVGQGCELVEGALQALLKQSHLPKERFVERRAAEQPDAVDERRIVRRSGARC